MLGRRQKLSRRADEVALNFDAEVNCQLRMYLYIQTLLGNAERDAWSLTTGVDLQCM